MSRESTAAENPFLTQYAQGLMNDLSQAQTLANALAPVVPVSAPAFQFKKFDDRNSFAVTGDTARGIGGAARRLKFDATDGSGQCLPQALEITIDDWERKQAPPGGVLAGPSLDQQKIRSLLNRAMLEHATAVVDYVVNNTTAVASRGNWSNASIDPVDQVDESLVTLITNTGGQLPITIAMGLNAWRVFRSHEKVKSRFDGWSYPGISEQQASGMFIVPVRFIVGSLVKSTTKFGAASVTKANVIGDHMIAVVNTPSASTYDPSAFKTFVVGGTGIEQVRTYRDDSSRSDVHAVDWNRAILETGTACSFRFAIS
jgi:hypothetical protein